MRAISTAFLRTSNPCEHSTTHALQLVHATSSGDQWVSVSFAFFGLHSPLYGLIVIIILWVLILLTILHFFKVTKIAGTLMLPYILWVSFAAVLNGAIFALN